MNELLESLKNKLSKNINSIDKFIKKLDKMNMKFKKTNQIINSYFEKIDSNNKNIGYESYLNIIIELDKKYKSDKYKIIQKLKVLFNKNKFYTILLKLIEKKKLDNKIINLHKNILENTNIDNIKNIKNNMNELNKIIQPFQL